MKKYNFFRYFCLVSYIICIIVLLVESGLSGSKSEIQSNTIGGVIANLFNNIKGDQTINIEPTSISIKDKIDVGYIGDKYSIVVNTLPENSTYKENYYISSNENVASVSNDGIVSFLDEGIVTITAYNSFNDDLYDSLTINVVKKEAISINSSIDAYKDENDIYSLYLGKTYFINTIFEPIDTTNKYLEYKLDSTSYISINEITGEITPLRISQNNVSIITIKHNNLFNTIKVKVLYKKEIPLESINVNSVSIFKNEIKELEVDFSPSDATFKNYELISKDENIIGIIDNKIKGINVGKCNVEVISKYNDSIRTLCKIEVKNNPNVDNYDIDFIDSLVLGTNCDINIINISPKYAFYDSIKYDSSNNHVAIVDEFGKIKALNEGKCNITVTINNIKKEKELLVINKVDNETEDFDLNTNSLCFYKDEKKSIDELIFVTRWYPKTPNNTNIKYELYDSSYGNIDSNNEIKFSKIGNTKLYVIHKDSGIYKIIDVTIIDDFDIYNENNDLISNEINEININEMKLLYILDNNSEQSYYIETNNSIDLSYNYYDKKIEINSINKCDDIEISIIPILDNKKCYELKKIIRFNFSHIYINDFSYSLYDENNNDVNTLYVNNKYHLDIKFNNDPTISKIIYKPSNDLIKIDGDGNIKTLKTGECKIKIIEEYSNIEKELDLKIINYIKVNDKTPFKTEGIDYDEESNTYSMVNGISGSFKINFDDKSTYREVTYSSSNNDIATIGSDGTITPLSVGKTEIKAVCNDNNNEPIEITITLEIKRQDFITDLKNFFLFIRKSIGHYGAFLVLGIFSSFTWLLFLDKKKKVYPISINFVSGFLIAGLTEIIQIFAPNRFNSFKDVLIDYSGFLTSSVIIVIIFVIYVNYKIKNKNDKSA